MWRFIVLVYQSALGFAERRLRLGIDIKRVCVSALALHCPCFPRRHRVSCRQKRYGSNSFWNVQ